MAVFSATACTDDLVETVDVSVGNASDKMVVCAGDSVVDGIDVSLYQGPIDWPAVADDGVLFGFARVSHGGFVDPEFETNWEGMRKNGLLRGAYHFFEPDGDVVSQATTFIDHVGTLGPGDLPSVLDIESHGGLTAEEVVSGARTWIDIVEAGTGRKAIIYTGSYFWNDSVGTTEFNGHPLWIAHYQTNCPNLPTAWDNWTFWQYSSTGSVSGIGENVDVNYFNGTIEQLNDLAANGYRAEVVNLQSTVKMVVGESLDVGVQIRNVGARAWSNQTLLGTSDERDRESLFAAPSWVAPNRVLAVGEVQPGDTVTLSFELHAPLEKGIYNEHFNLVQEGVAWFSDVEPGGGPADDEIAFEIVVVAPGEGASVGGGISTSGAGGGSPDSYEDVSCNIGGAVGNRAGAGWWLATFFVAFLFNSRRATARSVTGK